MTNPSLPLLSVCVPIYNAMPYLPERMDSIFAQDFQDYEIVVCDSYSNDGSWEYIQSLKDPRLRVYQVPRNGVYAGWNECLRRAQGRYIHFATADDKEDPNLYSTLIAILEKHPQIPLAYGKLAFIDDKGNPTRMDLWEFNTLKNLHQTSGILPQLPCHFFGLIYYPTWISINTAIYRKELHEHIGYWREDCYGFADCLFAEKYYRKFQSFYTTETTGYWRQHDTQQTHTQDEAKARKFRLEKRKVLIRGEYIDLYQKYFSPDQFRKFIRFLAIIEMKFLRKKLTLKERLRCWWTDLCRLLRGAFPCEAFLKNLELIKIIVTEFNIDLVLNRKEQAINRLNLLSNKQISSIKLKYSSKLPRNAVLPQEISIQEKLASPITAVIIDAFPSDTLPKMNPSMLDKQLPSGFQVIYLLDPVSQNERLSKENYLEQSIHKQIIYKENWNESLQYVFNSIRHPLTLFLLRGDSLCPSTVTVLSALMNQYQDIAWLMPTTLMFLNESEEFSTFEKTLEQSAFYLYNHLLTPGRFPVIFPRFAAVSGTIVRSEYLKQAIDWKRLPELGGLPLEITLLHCLGMHIKPAYWAGVSMVRDAKTFHEWLMALGQVPKSIRRQVLAALTDEHRRNYREYLALKWMYLLGNADSLAYKWVKKHLLTRALKARHSQTVFYYDKEKHQWERHERFMIKFIH
jgi:glycosyltransferase involved in cell wall biosynthesis